MACRISGLTGELGQICHDVSVMTLHGKLATILTAATLMVVVAALLRTLFGVIRHEGSREEYRRTVMAMRWWMIPAAIGQLSIVIAVYLSLAQQFPALQWGWWRLLGNSGNVNLGQTGQTGLIWGVVAVALPLLGAVAVPWLAHAEELMFRAGAERQGVRRRLRRQVAFGLLHFWSGIPIAACLALTVSGPYFLTVYMRAIRLLEPELEAAQEIPRYERLPYPALPANARYDSDARVAHRRERERMRAENDRRRNEWSDKLHDHISASHHRVDEVRRRAVATSAAAHAVSNWVLISLLLAWLVIS